MQIEQTQNIGIIHFLDSDEESTQAHIETPNFKDLLLGCALPQNCGCK
jgi:hypothetical protein